MAAVKGKRAEEGAESAAAAPCSALFSLLLSKLQRSLRHVEPDLRLRRFQGEMQPGPARVLQAALGQEDPSEGSWVAGALACSLSEPSWRLMWPPSPSLPVGGRLPCDGDASAFSDLLEDIGQPKEPPLSLLSPESERAAPACPPRTLDFPSLGSSLLEDRLEGVLGNIHTSVFDCNLWLPTSLPNFKEAFCSPGEQVPGLADHLDCLMDVLVGVQEL